MVRMPKGPAFTVPMPLAPRLRVMPIAPKHTDAHALARTILEAMRVGVSPPPSDLAAPSAHGQRDTPSAVRVGGKENGPTASDTLWPPTEGRFDAG